MKIKFLKRLNLFITLFFLSNNAQALFLVEPMAKSITATIETNGRLGNMRVQLGGVKLGYLNEYFIAGIEIQKGLARMEKSPFALDYKEYNAGGIGTFLGFHFYDRYKIWTGYLNTNYEPVKYNSIRYFGQQISFGIGIRIYSGFLLSYEVFNNYFTQKENDNTGITETIGKTIRARGSSANLSYMMVF